MKRLIQIAALLLLASPAWATWTAAQAAVSNTAGGSCGSTSGTTGTATFGSSTTSGNVLVMVIHGISATVSGVSGGGGTWVQAPGAAVAQGTNTLDIWYNLTGTGGGTVITATVSNNSARRCTVYELHSGAGTGFSVDASSGSVRSSGPSPVVGQALTLGASTDVIIQGVTIFSGTMSAISGGYTIDFNATTKAVASILNTSSGASPNWTVSGTTSAAVDAIAIREGAPPAGASNGNAIIF